MTFIVKSHVTTVVLSSKAGEVVTVEPKPDFPDPVRVLSPDGDVLHDGLRSNESFGVCKLCGRWGRVTISAEGVFHSSDEDSVRCVLDS